MGQYHQAGESSLEYVGKLLVEKDGASATPCSCHTNPKRIRVEYCISQLLPYRWTRMDYRLPFRGHHGAAVGFEGLEVLRLVDRSCYGL